MILSRDSATSTIGPVEMAAQRRQHILPIDADDEAQLAARPGPWRNGVDRRLRVAGLVGKDGKGAPAEHFLGRGQARLAPVRIDRRAALRALDLRTGERAATLSGIASGTHSGIRI